MTATHSTIPAFTKEVRYDAVTRDFAAYVNGQILGWTATYMQAQTLCDDFVYESLRRTSHADISDLTPEDAADILALQTPPEEATEAPKMAYCTINGVDMAIEPDGSMTIDPSGYDSKLIRLDAADTYALYLFFTHNPTTAKFLEQRDCERKNVTAGDLDHDALREQAVKQLMQEMEPKAVTRLQYEARQTGYNDGYEAGRAAALASIQAAITTLNS